MKRIHPIFLDAVYKIDIPYKGSTISRFLRFPQNENEYINHSCTGNLYTLPVPLEMARTYQYSNEESFQKDYINDLLFKCGDFTIKTDTQDLSKSLLFHNFRQAGTVNEFTYSGIVVDAVSDILKKHQEAYSFRSLSSFDLKSDYTKTAQSTFDGELDKMLKYAKEHQMKIYARTTTLQYKGTRHTIDKGTITEYVIKSKTRKDLLLAKVTKKYPHNSGSKPYKGSLIIEFPKKPFAYMEACYNETVQSFIHNDTIINCNNNYNNNYHDYYKTDYPLQVSKSLLDEYYINLRKEFSPEHTFNNMELTFGDFYSLYPKNEDELKNYIHDNFVSDKASSFKPALWQAKQLVKYADLIKSSYLGNPAEYKVLESNPDTMAFVKAAMKYLPEDGEYQEVKDAIIRKNPDKEIAKDLLGQGIAPYTVACLIHQYSPWQVYKDGLFADNTNAVALVKDASKELSSGRNHTLSAIHK